MKQNQNRWIMGGAIGLATVAVALDHTRHKLPEPQQNNQEIHGQYVDEDMTPCGLGANNPCGLSANNPYGLGSSNPCGFE
ncbi:MAG: hypothetical protein P8X88_03165 [Gammaproteobacteria bacterium]